MSNAMYDQSVPVFVRMLGNLSAIIDKAAAHCAENKIDPAVLLGDRLFPDMFAFARQVQIATDHAKGAAARLAGAEPPKFAVDEKSFDDLKARIAKTVDYCKAVAPATMEGSEAKSLTIPLRQPITLTGKAYLQGFALPNFYFHLTTAYNILRHRGVAIGKRDFLGPA